MILGGAGHHARQHPADARRGVRDGRPLDLLRADQICDPAAASAQGRSARRHRAGRGRHLYRHPRSARSSPASSRRRPRSAAAATIGIRRARLSRRPPGAARAARRRAAADHLAHHPRLDRAGQRDDAHPPAVPRDPRDQLLLDHRRGADHHLPAAGEERARRRRAGREPVHRHLLDRHRDRLGADQPPAEERGLGALRAGLGDRDGRVRAAAPLRRAGLGQARRRSSRRSAISCFTRWPA